MQAERSSTNYAIGDASPLVYPKLRYKGYKPIGLTRCAIEDTSSLVIKVMP